MLDYKNIIIKRYALNLSFRELAEEFGASRSGVNDFIRAFEKCDKLSDYYGAVEPPVRCGVSHLSELTEPLLEIAI